LRQDRQIGLGETGRKTGRRAEMIAAADREPDDKPGSAIVREFLASGVRYHIAFLPYLCAGASLVRDEAITTRWGHDLIRSHV
jgi:hypothetical protein